MGQRVARAARRHSGFAALSVVMMACSGPAEPEPGDDVPGVTAREVSSLGQGLIKESDAVMTGDFWDRTARLNLSYCVSEASFGARYNAVVQGLYQAVSVWENAANVRFVHKAGLDRECTVHTADVLFDVQSSAAIDAGRSFLPGDPRSVRQLLLNDAVAWDTEIRFLHTVLTHELGHILGFKHEAGDDADSWSTVCKLYPPGWETRLTAPDQYSVMMPPACLMVFPDDVRFLSQLDIEGVQAAYGAPTNIVLTQYGYFQRKMSTGELFRRIPPNWVYVGPPAQGYATADDQIYALTKGGGAIQQYVGPGDNWADLPAPPAPPRQIFACADMLCASCRQDTESQSKLYRFDGVAWSQLGDMGSRFSATDTALYSLSHLQDQLWWTDAAAIQWSPLNVALNEVFSTKWATYGLSTNRQMLRRLVWQTSGPRRTRPSWVNASGPIRQFDDGYVLAPDGSEAALLLNNGTKKALGGPFARLYAMYPYLYATDFHTLDAYHYNINSQSWVFVGQP